MTCTRCGHDIEADSAFCRRCGAEAPQASPSAHAVRRLVRLPSRGRIAGVCAGIADYLETDVTLIRLAWIVLSMVPGVFVGGLIAYLAACILMPEGAATVEADTRTRLTRSPVDRKLGGVCGGIAEILKIDSTVVRLAWVVLTIIPGVIIFGVLAYLVAWVIMPERHVAPMAATPQAV